MLMRVSLEASYYHSLSHAYQIETKESDGDEGAREENVCHSNVSFSSQTIACNVCCVCSTSLGSFQKKTIQPVVHVIQATTTKRDMFIMALCHI